MSDFIELSKEVSYALRHAPWKYELKMDEEGWVPVEQLLNALHSSKKWQGINQDDLAKMIAKSEKKRYKIFNGKIRAFYGHSILTKIIKEERTPPDILYHGTAGGFLNSIKEEGLLPQCRNYVHLSQDIETAIQVGKRRDNQPIVLIIEAGRVYQNGIKFYLGNEKVWLANSVPSQYIIVKKE